MSAAATASRALAAKFLLSAPGTAQIRRSPPILPALASLAVDNASGVVGESVELAECKAGLAGCSRQLDPPTGRRPGRWTSLLREPLIRTRVVLVLWRSLKTGPRRPAR